jgi:hypothetical protein
LVAIRKIKQQLTAERKWRIGLWSLALLNLGMAVLLSIQFIYQTTQPVLDFQSTEVRANLMTIHTQQDFNDMFRYSNCHEWVDLSPSQGERIFNQLQIFGWNPSQRLYEQKRTVYKVAIPTRYTIRSLPYQRWLDAASKQIRTAGFSFSVLTDLDYPAGGVLLRSFEKEADARNFVALPEVRKINGVGIYPITQDNLYHRIFVTVGSGISKDIFEQTLANQSIDPPQDCQADTTQIETPPH